MDISRSLFYAIRDGEREASDKVFAKLDAAERAAWVSSGPDPVSNIPAHSANNSGNPKENPGDSEENLSALEMVEILSRELAEKNRQLAEKDRQIERLLGLLESPPRPDDDSPEPPPPAGQRPGVVLRLRSQRALASAEPVTP